MTDDLKPCPWCGGRPELVELPDPDKRSGWTIRCCHIEDFAYESESPEAAIAAWNARAEPSVQEAARVLLAAKHEHRKQPYPDNMGPLNRLDSGALRAIAEKRE